MDNARTPTRIPGIGEFILPLSRNDLMLLLVGMNLIMVGLESYLAHLISGSIKPMESIPVFFGPIAGLVLFLALFVRIQRKQVTLASLLIIGVAAASVGVGILGSAFHWERDLAPVNLPGNRLRWNWLIYGPPALAPLAFAGIGLMGIIAALEDTKPESGKLTIPGLITLNTPLKQTQQLLWLVGLGLLAATVSSFMDHGRTDFENIFVWIPVVFGVFGSVVTVLMAVYEKRTSSDYFIFFWTMMLMVLVGVMGFGLHVNTDLAEGTGEVLRDRFIRGAPPLAPLLFANMGLLGIISMIGAEAIDE
ncbi:MAG: hypothetical protein H6673_06995 [Anaerolineales bacterium]|nr:hypothetical protein [Anaerolineales bacterium]